MAYGPQRSHFVTRKRVRIDRDKCVGCRLCMKFCPVGGVIAFDEEAGVVRVVNPVLCGGCYMCLRRCPAGAIRPVAVRKEAASVWPSGDVCAPGQKKVSPSE